jgi:putative transposase
VEHLTAHLGLSERRGCRLVGLSRGTHSYKTKSRSLDEAVRKRMREIAEKKRRWGCPLIHKVLKREGLVRNHKRTERLYREEKLSLRTRKRKKRACHLRVEMPMPERANQRWSMDFVSDRIWRGRRFRVFTIVDDYTRECLALEVDTSIGGARVARVLDRIVAQRGRPEWIRMDNGPEFTGQAMDEWAYRNGVRLDFIDPGKPTQNAFIESFNSILRRECLNDHWFTSLQEARDIIEAWRLEYNRDRPHGSLGDLTPQEFATKSASGLYLEVAQ